jgi:methylenetetrahydrofolate reductase (NADPH)
MTHRQLSFEFFPPKNEQQQANFERARDKLGALSPEYMSVTFGAGGSTRNRTFETVRDIAEKGGVPAAPHISCMSEDIDSIRELLDQYRDHDIDRLVVLRGDRPSGGGSGVFDHAVDLVRFIRERYDDTFRIEVACYPEHHPESPSPDQDLLHFRDKVAAGADGAITQYFFSAESYFRFVDEARALGVDVPIVPGIMPITNYSGLARFSKMCGAEIPLWIAKRIEAWERDGDTDSLRHFGREVVAGLCQRLIDGGAPGLHFYTLNRARACLGLCEDLGLGTARRSDVA